LALATNRQPSKAAKLQANALLLFFMACFSQLQMSA